MPSRGPQLLFDLAMLIGIFPSPANSSVLLVGL